MPPKTISHKRSCPISLDEDDINYIHRAGIGKNFSEKTRSVIRRAKGQYDILTQYEGTVLKYNKPSALCVYYEQDGERVWEDLPFEYNKKLGYTELPNAASQSGYICQVVELPEDGFLAVWIAPMPTLKDCNNCRLKVLEAMK